MNTKQLAKKYNISLKKPRLWAVIMRDEGDLVSNLAFTWDKKHPENKREADSVRVMAIYPNKDNALADVRFRSCCYVKEVDVILK